MKTTILKTLNLPTAVLALDLSPDATHLYAACMDGGVYRVDAKSGESHPLYKHDSFASGVFSIPSTPLLLSAGYDGILQWHDLSTNTPLRKIQAHQFWSWQSALSPDGQLLASVTGQYLAGGLKYEPAPETEPSVKIFDSHTGELRHSFTHVPPVQAVAFAPDGHHLAAGNLMGEIRVWDLSTGQQVAAWTTPAFTSWGIIKSHCYQGGIYSLAFTPDSQHVIACGMGPMRDPMAGNGKQTWQRFAWNKPNTPKIDEIHDGDHGAGHPETLAFHPSGHFFVMAGRLAQGKWNTAFFDTATGNLLHSLDTKGRLIKALFSPDGKTLFLAGCTAQPKPDHTPIPDFGRIIVCSIEP